MFGDPEINSMNLSVKPMTEVCEIIDGDRGKNYPTQEEFFDEGYCLFLNAKNVTSSGFSFENCMFVTKEKDEILRKGHLNRGDVVLTTRGTIGNLAFYDETVPYDNVRINSGMVILRMNHKMVSERFFIEQFKMQLSSIKEKIASGSAQPQLPISTMNKIVVLMPPVEQQQVFADFVTQVDKSKVATEKALNETQKLFDRLIQEYVIWIGGGLMAIMTVYHGGYETVECPEIRVGRNTKDFGTGFYCTIIKEQAQRWARRYDTKIVSIYDVRIKTDLKIKEFKEMTEEWLDFIIACRSGEKHNHDIVIGAMADDQVYNYISDYMDGTITREQFWVLARFKYPTHQIVFCTEDALQCLEYRGFEEVV